MKRKLEIEMSVTERVEETVKEAEAHLNAKEYDYQGLLVQLDQLKGGPGSRVGFRDWSRCWG